VWLQKLFKNGAITNVYIAACTFAYCSYKMETNISLFLQDVSWKRSCESTLAALWKFIYIGKYRIRGGQAEAAKELSRFFLSWRRNLILNGALPNPARIMLFAEWESPEKYPSGRSARRADLGS
jgi:hypothetical protein